MDQGHDLSNFNGAGVRAESTTKRGQVEGRCTKVVSIISRDKAKSQIYCQVTDLGEQIDNEKDSKKAEALVVKMNDLEKQLGPEYLALLEASKDVDPNSKDGQDVMSMFDELDESCPD